MHSMQASYFAVEMLNSSPWFIATRHSAAMCGEGGNNVILCVEKTPKTITGPAVKLVITTLMRPVLLATDQSNWDPSTGDDRAAMLATDNAPGTVISSKSDDKVTLSESLLSCITQVALRMRVRYALLEKMDMIDARESAL